MEKLYTTTVTTNLLFVDSILPAQLSAQSSSLKAPGRVKKQYDSGDNGVLENNVKVVTDSNILEAKLFF